MIFKMLEAVLQIPWVTNPAKNRSNINQGIYSRKMSTYSTSTLSTIPQGCWYAEDGEEDMSTRYGDSPKK